MKAIFIILALLAGPKLCPADDRNLGLSQTAAVDNVQTVAAALYARSSDGRLRQVFVNTDGTLAVAPSSSAAYAGVTVTAINSAYASVTNATATWTTHTVTTYNLTSTAGEAVPLEVWLNAGQGGAAVRYWFHPTAASAPAAAMLSVSGNYCAATTTVQVTGKWVAGTHLSVIGVGAASTTGTLSLVK